MNNKTISPSLVRPIPRRGLSRTEAATFLGISDRRSTNDPAAPEPGHVNEGVSVERADAIRTSNRSPDQWCGTVGIRPARIKHCGFSGKARSAWSEEGVYAALGRAGGHDERNRLGVGSYDPEEKWSVTPRRPTRPEWRAPPWPGENKTARSECLTLPQKGLTARYLLERMEIFLSAG